MKFELIRSFDLKNSFSEVTNNMATNKPYGDNHRNGPIKDRSQVYNPKIDHWVKRDAETGRFMDQKTSDNEPFKGVIKEK